MKAHVLALGLLVVGCSDARPERDRTVGVSDSGAPISLTSILGKSLDSLTPPELATLCREEAQRTDYCLNFGLRASVTHTAPAPGDTPPDVTCRDAVAACRGATASGTPDVDCSGVSLGSSRCPISARDYLACVDAWNASQTCDNAGWEQPPPAACQPLSDECPLFQYAFHSGGRSRPCPADAGASPPESDDIHGLDRCRPRPERFVVLGDSIAACDSPGLDPTQCGPRLIFDHLQATFSPKLMFESYAVPGAVVGDVPGQAALVPAGPGQVYVWSNVVGNDLLQGNDDLSGWQQAWASVFATFADTSRFPDGVTFLFNTQFSPYDECGGMPSPIETELRDANQHLYLDVAEARPDAIAVDQYPSWLGHGDHAGELSCGRCSADNTQWVSVDGVHPNAAGFAHMAAKWIVATDRMLEGCP